MCSHDFWEKSCGSSKQPYQRPQVTNLTSTEAKTAIETKAIPGDAGAQVILEKLNGREDATATAREVEIEKELESLYQQLEEFSDPTPAEQPNEYEVEELEAWEI